MENQRIYKFSTQMKQLLAKEASAGVGKGTVGPKQLTKKQAAEQAEKERIQRQEAKAAQRQKEQERLRLKDVARLGRERQERKRKLAEKQQAQADAARALAEKREVRSANQQLRLDRKEVERVVRELLSAVVSTHKANLVAQRQHAVIQSVINRLIRNVELGNEPRRKRGAKMTPAQRAALDVAKKEAVVQRQVERTIDRMIKSLEKRAARAVAVAANAQARAVDREIRATVRNVMWELVSRVEYGSLATRLEALPRVHPQGQTGGNARQGGHRTSESGAGAVGRIGMLLGLQNAPASDGL
eukprot:COSAG05_NODE_1976_length_3764_cov_134.699864_1_plen_301_part_00